ncbi:MAG: 16S rRNA (guanine(966)-N(2))-methyltransferase RsmD [Polyangiaceae bacterium]|nr:16S rRNA (guanine(966)-N(2))-methyltransferase RsmD [Polyangiaceae bacterium]
MRVISGTLRGRRLRTPRGQGTRPTPDRVREALFSVLGSVADARVLDLYAGTGALGIEALSRGAASAGFVERARPALEALGANLVELGLEPVATVWSGSVAQVGAALSEHGPYDLVLADPPYDAVASGEAVRALERLFATPGVLAPHARLVLEHAARDATPGFGGFGAPDVRRYGDTALAFYERLEHGSG